MCSTPDFCVDDDTCIYAYQMYCPLTDRCVENDVQVFNTRGQQITMHVPVCEYYGSDEMCEQAHPGSRCSHTEAMVAVMQFNNTLTGLPSIQIFSIPKAFYVQGVNLLPAAEE